MTTCTGRCKHGGWKLRHIPALGISYFTDALLFNFVYSKDRMKRQVGSSHTREFCFYTLLRWINNDAGTSPKNKLLNLNKTK